MTSINHLTLNTWLHVDAASHFENRYRLPSSSIVVALVWLKFPAMPRSNEVHVCDLIL